jgi:hypothetical protein
MLPAQQWVSAHQSQGRRARLIAHQMINIEQLD